MLSRGVDQDEGDEGWWMRERSREYRGGYKESEEAKGRGRERGRERGERLIECARL